MNTQGNLALWQARSEIAAHARSLGFDLVGFTGAKVFGQHEQAFRDWLALKREGGMAFLRDTQKIEMRADATKILPGARTVISTAMNYYRPQPPLKKGYARVARYAYGRDYHKIMGKALRKLARFVEECGAKYFPGETVRAKSFVDIGPIFERAFAQQAGLGTVGKNSLLITKEFGSWVLLGEVITTLPLVLESTSSGLVGSRASAHKGKGRESEPELAEGEASVTGENLGFPQNKACGSCTRCIQACPTGAIIAPSVIDSRLCISYLTIEHKGPIPEKLRRVIKKTRRIFGCDICQEVCPHNSRQKPTEHPEFTNPAIARDAVFLRTLRAINTDTLFHRKFAGSAVKRAKRSGLRRNAGVIVSGPTKTSL